MGGSTGGGTGVVVVLVLHVPVGVFDIGGFHTNPLGTGIVAPLFALGAGGAFNGAYNCAFT